MIAIIDVEASSLFNGYPIEIGWAREDGHCGAYLVKPEPKWAELNWDAVAEQVHGLSLELCARLGKPVKKVIDSLNTDLADCECFSDSPETDWRWMALLLKSFGQEEFTFDLLETSADALFLSDAETGGLPPGVIRYISERAERAHAHTAAGDAAAWMAAIEAGISQRERLERRVVDDIFGSWGLKATLAAPWRPVGRHMSGS